MMPQRWATVDRALAAGRSDMVIQQLMPAEAFYLAHEMRLANAERSGFWGKAGQELDELSAMYPEETKWERIAKDFGVPHPSVAHTYEREMYVMKPMPTFLGYSSRLLAETWESSNLYWARLAAEKGLHPSVLHTIVPELTQRMVEKIFASHLEDWPAILRAMKETGDIFMEGKVAVVPALQPETGF